MLRPYTDSAPTMAPFRLICTRHPADITGGMTVSPIDAAPGGLASVALAARIDTAVARKALDAAAQQGQALVSLLEAAVETASPPDVQAGHSPATSGHATTLGQHLDVTA